MRKKATLFFCSSMDIPPHTKNLDVIDLARDNGVILRYFSPPPIVHIDCSPLMWRSWSQSACLRIRSEAMIKNKSRESGHAVANINTVRSIFARCENENCGERIRSDGYLANKYKWLQRRWLLPAATTDISIVKAPATAPEDPALNFSPQTLQSSWKPDGPPQATFVATPSASLFQIFLPFSRNLLCQCPKLKLD